MRLAKGQWLQITLLGYKLQESGEYTIVVIPQISGFFAVTDTTTVRSNQVTFTISE